MKLIYEFNLLLYFKQFYNHKAANAGNPVNPTNTEFSCSGSTNQETVGVNSAKIIQSEGYPKYPANTVNCVKDVVVASADQVLDVYLNFASFPGSGTAALVYKPISNPHSTIELAKT